MPPKGPDVFIDSSTENEASNIKLLDSRMPNVQKLFENTYTVKIGIADYEADGVGGQNADLRILFPHQFKTLPEPGSLPANTQLHDMVPTRITPESVAQAALEAGEIFEPFRANEPVYTVILGERLGKKDTALSIKDAETLAQEVLAAVKETGGSVLVTTSQRTSPESLQAFQTIMTEGLADETPIYFYDYRANQGNNNPYLIQLGMADRIISMDDSMSMASDMVVTGKPVFIVQREKDPEVEAQVDGSLHQRYMAGLSTKGLTNPISALTNYVEQSPKRGHNSASDIADTIKKALVARAANQGIPLGKANDQINDPLTPERTMNGR